MTSTAINYLSIIATAVAILGLSVHDTHLDKAVVKAVSPLYSSSSETNVLATRQFAGEHHIHVEANTFASAFSLRAHLPSKQPKNEDDKKYITSKRLKNNAFGTEYIWPSI